ncbi:MAG TPA: hypothetical protein VFQ41_12090 [Candidatus Angelobacter sp.]|nr:hypothetical protein [Candidatus Angelobacter sp.]
MTPAHLWTWPIWTLLILNLIAEAAVLWLTVSRNFYRRLLMLAVFAGFCLLADITSIVLGFTTNVAAANGSLWSSRSYWLFYWGEQIVAGILVLLLALQIITAILPPWTRLITLLSLAAFIAIAMIYYKLLPTTKASDVLTVVTLADVVAVLFLPIIWVVKPSAWPKGMKLIASGLVISMVLQALCTAAGALLKTLVGIVTIGVPLSSLIGMGFFFTAIRQTEIQEAPSMKRVSETHSLCEDNSPLSPSKLA